MSQMRVRSLKQILKHLLVMIVEWIKVCLAQEKFIDILGSKLQSWVPIERQ